MPMELRKRKAPAEPVQQSAPKKKTSRANTAATTKKAKGETKAPAAPAASTSKAPAVGETIDLDNFEDEITFQDGTTTSLKALVAESESGVVLFTYPRASTPGCKYTDARRVASRHCARAKADVLRGIRYQPSLPLPR